MKIKLLTLATFPRKNRQYWQIVFMPTVSMYHSHDDEKHVAINFEWLFWSATILIYTDDKRPVYQIENI